MSGESEPGLVKHGLGDRVCHHRPRLAAMDRLDRALYRFDRRGRVGGARPAGLGLDCMLERDDRQAFGEFACRRGRVGLDDRRLKPGAPGGGGEDGRRRQNEERRAWRPVAPGGKRELRPDPRRVAHRHRQRRFVACHDRGSKERLRQSGR